MNNKIKSSFRDPSGFVFQKDNEIYRQINICYKQDYKKLISSGLYNKLTSLNLLVQHQEIDDISLSSDGYLIIKPVTIPFISYPYEWSFSQLKDAALTTLKIQKIALNHGMNLKDASAYNIQFQNSKPVLIDTLSFEINKVHKPWQAYKQFCQHFLAPLLLMSYEDVKLNQLLKVHLDGIPIGLTSKLMPFKTRFNFHILSHIFLHASSQQKNANKKIEIEKIKFDKNKTYIILDSLTTLISNLNINGQKSEWEKYYTFSNYSELAFENKKKIVENYIAEVNPSSVIDLGANDGTFSRIASNKGIFTISCDYDPLAIESNYCLTKIKKESNILPLLLDITNPSPAIGWNNDERLSFTNRLNADLVLALALIHHLAISNNIPLNYIAEYFSKLGKYLIIEFVPKSDSQVIKLLENREDIFINYNQTAFEEVFSTYYFIRKIDNISNSDRIMYLMEKK